MSNLAIQRSPNPLDSPQLLQAVSILILTVEQASTAAATLATRAEFERLYSERNDLDRSLSKETMTRAELRTELNICSQTAMNWERQGILKRYSLGRRVFYKRAEVIAAMQAQTRSDGTRRNARRGQQQKAR